MERNRRAADARNAAMPEDEQELLPSVNRNRRGIRLLALAALLAMGLAACTGGPPSAPDTAPTFDRVELRASVGGGVVTARSTIAARPDVAAHLVGVCARNATGGIVDFPFDRDLRVGTGGTAVIVSRELSAGDYTYWSCAQVDGHWHDIGPKENLVVPEPVTPTSAAPDPSGEPMPTGDLPGWRQIFTDDFTTDVPAGGFPGPYSQQWSGYDGFADTSGQGEYAQRIISVHDSMLDLFLHTENGVPLGAAPVPLIHPGRWGGQVYGRYVIRFKSDRLPGYGTGWLLWPDSGIWNEGEIDFPEGSLGQEMEAFDHCIGHAGDKCVSANTGVDYTQWHTATIEWAPQRLSFLLDGRTIATTTQNIPDVSMRWTLQTATNDGPPAAPTAGHVLIDWVAIYALA